MSNSKSDKERTGLYWYQLKEIRAIVMFEQDYGCGECGSILGRVQGDAHLHHIDENPKHNFRGNLLVLCPKCHAIAHGFDPEHFLNMQPLTSSNTRGMCAICTKQTELKDGLCPKCYSEHYSNYKEPKSSKGL